MKKRKNLYYDINKLNKEVFVYTISEEAYLKLLKLNKLLEDLKDIIKSEKETIHRLEWVNDYKEEQYPPAYYRHKGRIEILEYFTDIFGGDK